MKKLIPLARAAMELRVSREVALRKVMRRELDGEQDAGGRWLVEAESLYRLSANLDALSPEDA